MSTKKDQPKTTDELSGDPPEHEFFDPPGGKGKAKSVGNGLFGKDSIRFLVLGTVIFVFCLAVFYPRVNKKQRNAPPLKEEKRVMVTTSSMEQAIDASGKGKKPLVRRAADTLRKSKKRKFDSDIAAFIANPKGQNRAVVRRPPKKEDISLGLPSGARIPALLSNRVFSFNVESPVTAILAKDFMFKDEVVIPKDSQFLGEAAVIKSVDRINVRFDLLILPDGTEIRVRAMALSEDGSAGIRGRVDKHTDRRILKAIGESILAGASLFTGGRRTDPFSLEDQMRMNLARNLTDEAARDLRSTKIEKSVTVDAYTPIQVILLESV